MRIAALLSSKGTVVATIRPGATVAEAVGDLARHGVGALVVSADGVRIDGIVSERDVVRGLEGGGALLERPVSSIMSSTVYTCSPEDDTDSLVEVMTDRRIRHVPVVDADGRLGGIVSIGDVVKTRLGELEQHRKELYDYINAR